MMVLFVERKCKSFYFHPFVRLEDAFWFCLSVENVSNEIFCEIVLFLLTVAKDL